MKIDFCRIWEFFILGGLVYFIVWILITSHMDIKYHDLAKRRYENWKKQMKEKKKDKEDK